MFNFDKNKPKLKAETRPTPKEDGFKIIRHDLETTGKDNVDFLELAAEKSGIPIYKGQVKHIYESDFTGFKDKCPRCEGAVLRMMSNFPYATQKASRIMTAPAGLFCQSCPTVIIDDDIMIAAIDTSRFEYWGVFSVEDGYNELSPIETLNGETPIIVLDETQTIIEGILQSVHQPIDGVFMDPKTNTILGMVHTNAVPLELTNALRKQKSKKKSRNKSAKKVQEGKSEKVGHINAAPVLNITILTDCSGGALPC